MHKFASLIENNNIENLRNELNSYKDINIPNIDGTTLLYKAVLYNKINIVKLLLEKGSNLNIVNSDSYGAFESIGDDYIEEKSKHGGEKPLELADDKNKEIIKILIKHGENPNFTYKDNGLSGLYRAILDEDIEYAAFLLNSGANLNEINDFSPRERNPSLEDKRLLQIHKIKSTSDLIFNKDSLKIIKKLLLYIDNINSLLCCSIEKKEDEISKLLIDKSNDLNMPCIKGSNKSPLYSAVFEDNFEMLELLLEKGANPDFITIACEKQNLKIVKLLIEYKVDVNKIDENGEVALYYAINAKKANKEIIRFLINNGADINKENDNGISPLSFAESSKVSLVKVLIENHKIDLSEKKDIGTVSTSHNLLEKIILQNKVINKLQDEVKNIKNKLILNEEVTKKIINDFSSKLNKLEQKLDKQKKAKTQIPLNLATEKQSIKKDDGVIVKRESFDDF